MIKRYIDKLFGRREPVTHKDARPVVYGKDKHSIAREHISKCARRTCEELQRAGFAAFVVGGAVRDLLLGIRPKDFDVATSATPEEVRSVFRRSRIIGRRFQIVHVLCGAETVEVSTFRAHFTREADAENTDEHGRMLSDNVFGTQAEDAMRRDFTVNALFYDPVKEEVWDYVHGMKDLKAKKLVMIGEPAARFREDPVRMLRAARLAAKLGLEIDAKTREPIPSLRHLLENVPAGAPLRGDPEAPALGQRRRVREDASRAAAAPRPAAAARHGAGRSRRGCLSPWRRCAPPTSASPMTGRSRRHSCWPRSCGDRSRRTSRVSRRRGSPRFRRCTTRCTRRSTPSASRSRSRGGSMRR